MPLKIEDFLRTLTLPKHYFSEDFNITDKFKDEAYNFLTLLNELKDSDVIELANKDKEQEFQKQLIDIVDIVAKNIESIVTIFSNYEDSDLKAAQEEFDNLMIRIKDDIFIASIYKDYVKLRNNGKDTYASLRITPGYEYYRIRPAEYEDINIEKNSDELFHIPLGKRAYSNNQRFSLAGFPSLYLSTMLPLAWQECGYPQKYYYSTYKYTPKYEYTSNKTKLSEIYDDNLRFLGLYSPYEIYYWGMTVKYNYFDLWLEVISRYLKTYPLTLACSFVNHSGKVPFKQEYIIPQMLLQWVKRNSDFVQGISYFSCIDRTKFQSKWMAYNIVVLALPELDNKGYSKTLRDLFNWSKPNFYTPPLIDKKKNYKDREVMHKLIEKTTYIKLNNLPNSMIEYLNNLNQIACCFMSLLENASTMDMELAIHILDLLWKNSETLEKMNIEDIINKSSDDNTWINTTTDIERESICIKFREFCECLLVKSNYENRLSNIIHKYETTLWNY